MALSERFRIIMKENNLIQRQLAMEIGVTESYISSILSGRNKKISHALANLIEQKYGYCVQWVLHGAEPKLKQIPTDQDLTEAHQKAINLIEGISEKQAMAVLAFISSLEEVSKELMKDE